MTASQNDHVREEDFHVNLTAYHYQVDLLLLFLWRGYKNEYNFQLQTESKDAEKFDDLVFSYQQNGKRFVNYLQAKYSKDEMNRWNYQDFAADRNIAIGNLKKYFTSFRKIKQKFGDEFAENFFLCSNIAFESLKLKKHGNSEDDFLEFVETTENIELTENGRNIKKDIFLGFQNNVIWKTYKIKKFSSDIYEKLLKVTNLSILAEELANCIINTRKTNDTNVVVLDMENFWFSKYNKVLENESIIEKNQEVITFSSWFTTDKKIKTDEIILLDNKDLKFNLLGFRQIFKEEYEKWTSMTMKSVVFNEKVSQYFNDNIKKESKKLEIENKDSLHKLAASLVKHALEENGELDEILKTHFDIIKKVLTKTKRTAFTSQFIDGENLDENAKQFRKLLFQNLEKNAVKMLESETLPITESFYVKFQNEHSLENKVVESCAEKVAAHLVFKRTLTHEILSKQSVVLLKSAFDCVDSNHVKLKGSFLKNRSPVENESFRRRFFESYFKNLLVVKEIIFRFNVKELDNLVNKIYPLTAEKEHLSANRITFDKICEEEETWRLIKSLNGFVFEKVADEGDTIKFVDSFITGENFLDEMKLLKAKLKKKLNAKDLLHLKNYEFQISDFHCCSTSLNENENVEEEIIDFCQKLAIVTSPDEKGIVDCVKTEMENKYDMQVANYATDKLMHKTLNFAKGNDGRYITYQTTEQFFDDIVLQTKVHEMALITSQYCDMLKSYEICFEENGLKRLVDFLQNINDMKSQILHITMEVPVLAAIKVEQVLQNNNALRNNFIFCSLSLLQSSKISALSAFESKYVQMIIIVDDETVLDESVCDEIFSNVEKNDQKRVLMITRDESFLGRFFCDISVNNLKVLQQYIKYDTTFFRHLTADSRNALLTKVIKFNGEDIQIKKFITDNGFCDLLDCNTILQIFADNSDKILEISQPYSEKTVEYYVKRYINFTEFNDELFDEKKQLEDHFFVVKSDEENNVMHFLRNKGVKRERIATVDENFGIEKKPYFIIISPTQAEKALEKIDNIYISALEGKHTYTSHSVHWLIFRDGKLIWCEYDNHIFSTVPFKSQFEFCITRNTAKIHEDDFFRYTYPNKLTIICDAAGMGKSTILKSLIDKKKDQHIWPVRIDLNEYTKFLSNFEAETYNRPAFDFSNFDIETGNYGELILQTFGNYNSYVSNNENFAHFLSECVDPKRRMTFENYMFLYFFFKGRVLIIFDAYDEICPTYSNLVLRIISHLKEERKNHIWVTSRPNCQATLEKRLETFAFTLHPFSDNDQFEYLTNVWKQQWNGDIDDVTEKSIEKYAMALIHRFKGFIGEEYISYMGIPLKMKMMAEIFKENEEYDNGEKWLGCFDYLKALNCGKDTEADLKLSYLNMNMHKLYDIFIKKKVHRFLNEKVKADYTKSYGPKIKNIIYRYQHDIHKILALMQLTNEQQHDLKEERKQLVTEKTEKYVDEWIQDFKNGIENLGIVAKIINNRPIFEHLTYAEYFCASFLMEQLSENAVNRQPVFKILNVILESSVPVFQYCVKHLMEHKIGLTKLETLLKRSSAITFSVKHGFVNCVKFFITDKKYSGEFPNRDKFGKTLLHHAVEHQQLPIVVYILLTAWTSYSKETYNSYFSSLLKFYDVHDNNAKKAIDYASNNKNIFNLLNDVHKSAKTCVFLNSSQDFEHKKLCVYEYLQNILQRATYDTIKHFINNVSHTEVLELCTWKSINFFDDIAVRNDLKEYEKHQIFEYMWKKVGDSEKALLAEYILFAAIENHCSSLFETFFCFLEKEKYDFPSKLVSSCMWCAFRLRNISVVTFLCKRNYDDPMILHVAILETTSLDILKYLFENTEINSNVKDRYGTTLILSALEMGCKLGVIKYLVQLNAEINYTNEEGDSALKWAIEKNKDDIIKLFLNSGQIPKTLSNTIKEYYNNKEFDINEKTDDKNRLHYAVFDNDINTSLFLLQKGANVNATDDYGKTALHYACEKDLLNIAFYLLDYGAIYDKLDNSQKEPFDYCSPNSEIIDFLNKAKADFAKVSQYTCKLEETHFPVVDKFVVLTKASNKENKTLWHIAAEGRNSTALYELSKSNFARKVINQKDSDGNIALHLALEKDSYGVVLKLLKYGSFYDLKNGRNKSAVQITQNGKHDNEIVQLLKKIDELFYAVKYMNLQELVKDRYYEFMDITKFKEDTGKSLLHHAIIRRSSSDAQLLLDRQADINSRDEDNHTPVYYAVKNDDFAMLKKLIKYNARICKKDFREMIKNECTDFVEKFYTLLNGIYEDDINQLIMSFDSMASETHISLLMYARDYQGSNIMNYALKLNNYDLVVKLFENGATTCDYLCLYQRFTNQRKDAYLFQENKKVERLQKFISQVFGCVEENDCDSNSLIQLIEYLGYQKIITNVKLQKRNQKSYIFEGRTLLNHAAISNNIRIVKWCIDNGADCFKKDMDGLSAFQAAERYKGSRNKVLPYLKRRFPNNSR